MNKIFSLLLIATGFLLSTASVPKQSQDGWHIRICPTGTTAPRIWFETGAGDDSHDKTRSFNWRQGRNNVVDIHSDFRYKTDLNFVVDTKGKGIAIICVLYDNRVVKTMEVHTKVSHTINNNETGTCPC
jgi:hypothetical protein